jgi:hypothetical protein
VGDDGVRQQTMLVAAGLLGDAGSAEPSATEEAILRDPRLTDDQRASLLAVYRSYTAGA